jgi:hypothetical protein
VRIARYLDMLTQAGGGPRRPELAPEQSAGGDDLDFDREMFESFKPAPGAPGPDQAPEWEDTDQPEADIAAALGMDLAELRALRTPVPVVPAGMSPITGKPARISEERAVINDPPDEVSVTNPLAKVDLDEPPRRAQTDEGDGDGGEESTGVRDEPRRPTPRPVRVRTEDEPTLDRPAAPIRSSPAPRSPVPSASGNVSRMPTASSPFADRIPWILVGLLAIACLALAGYIAMS